MKPEQLCSAGEEGSIELKSGQLQVLSWRCYLLSE